MRTVRATLSYANVMATIAVFIALGGTSYALAKLPRDSVGSRQLKANSVGSSELRSGSVRSQQIRNGSIATKDVSNGAKRSLRGERGPQGPPGTPAVTLSAAVSSGGNVLGGTGGGTHVVLGRYDIGFGRDLRSCRAVASLARVSGDSSAVEIAPNGEIVTETTTTGVTVHTYNSQGQPTDLPFNLVVAC